MGGSEQEGATTLEFTPTWVVAGVCTVIVAISLALERILHYTGKYLKKNNQKPLFEALQKVKEELMLLGFISLLLTVFQNVVVKICVPAKVMRHLLPCSLPPEAESTGVSEGTPRRLLAEGSTNSYCSAKHEVPLLSLEALHHLHVFIFVLAIVHVTFSVLTVVFGGARIRQWKKWEDSIAKATSEDSERGMLPKLTHVKDHDFIKSRFLGIEKHSSILGWVQCFFKQFYASVNKSDYEALRWGFITSHCKGNPKFNFHKYMLRALEDDFKKVVGISWYLWVFVVIFLLLNISGWHTYFWIAFIPFILLLAVGTKLEHVITQLANEVAEKHVAIQGELVVKPSDDHFWFRRPRIVLFLIHFILFQNAFEIAFFFWIWVQYGFDSCIMGQVRFIVPRLIIGVIIQLLCSYSTLPLYALVTQMGTHFKKSVFDEHVQAGIVGWAQKAKKKKGAFKDSVHSASDQGGSTVGSALRGLQMGGISRSNPGSGSTGGIPTTLGGSTGGISSVLSGSTGGITTAGGNVPKETTTEAKDV